MRLKTKYLKLLNTTQTISETENKITTDHDHEKYITTQVLNNKH